VDLDGVPHLMGRLWARTRKNKESATFEYDKTWLENPARFSLEPALQVGPGPFHTPADTPMFGAPISLPTLSGDSMRLLEAIASPSATGRSTRKPNRRYGRIGSGDAASALQRQ
jgi:serine/threonine-protein kinase HipA